MPSKQDNKRLWAAIERRRNQARNTPTQKQRDKVRQVQARQKKGLRDMVIKDKQRQATAVPIKPEFIDDDSSTSN